jgi:hypothetical protein
VKNNNKTIRYSLRYLTAPSLLLVLYFGIANSYADPIGDANRLLRVTDMGNRFNAMTTQQTQIIIRTYSSIVSMSAQVALPPYLKRTIAACYTEVYAWRKFRAGIAQILVDVLDQKELLLLIDFYSSRSLPPMEIPSFKGVIRKADRIQRLSEDYIYAHTDSCVERDAELIFSYLGNRHRTGELEVTAKINIEERAIHLIQILPRSMSSLLNLVILLFLF